MLRRALQNETGTPQHIWKAVAMWLESVLLGLETLDDEGWAARTQIVEHCLSELKKARKGDTDHGQSILGVDRAMLNIRAMAAAMKRRDRLTAVETGEAACLVLSHELSSLRILRGR